MPTTVRNTGLILLFLGLVFISASLFVIYKNLEKISRYTAAEGTVVKIETITDEERTTYRPFARFETDDGRLYTATMGGYSSFVVNKVGDSVKIYYDPNNPQNSLYTDWFHTGALPLIFGSIGFGLLAGGWFAYKKYSDQIALLQFLKSHGTRISTEFVEFRDKNYQINKKRAFSIVSKGSFNGQSMTFESQDFFDAKLRALIPNRVQVLVDPRDPSQHAVPVEQFRTSS